MGDGSDLDPELYEIAQLLDAFRHEDREKRRHAVRSLPRVATALGPERTREELVPFLSELLSDEKDILLAVADELSRAVPLVGGPAHVEVLLLPLEELANVDQDSVRDAAVAAITDVCKEVDDAHVQKHVLPVFTRLSSGFVRISASYDWYSSKLASCSIMPAILPRVDRESQEGIVRAYEKLATDDTPMVRRAAAQAFSGAVMTAPEDLRGRLLGVVEQFAKDGQDSVRIMTVTNAVFLARKLPLDEWRRTFLPELQARAKDKSWAVRHQFLVSLSDLVAVDRELTLTDLLPLFRSALNDSEAEVREIGCSRLVPVVQAAPAALPGLLGAVEKLAMDPSEPVRAALAGAIAALAAQATSLHRVLAQLARDDAPGVRLRLVGAFAKTEFAQLPQLVEPIIHVVHGLCRDTEWRVRYSVLALAPQLAKNANLNDAFREDVVQLLGDKVFAVRELTTETMRDLARILGPEWAKAHVHPRVKLLLAHSSYLLRISALRAVAALSEVYDADRISDELVPMIEPAVTDTVPNVRLNACKCIAAILDRWPEPESNPRLGVLARLSRELREDSDVDVQQYAWRMGVERSV